MRRAHPMQPVDSFAWRLESTRREKGMTLTALSALTGIAKPSLSNYEKGVRHPQSFIVAVIAKELGVSPCWLAFGEGEP